MNREQFLALVAEYVANDPESAPYVTEAARKGVSDALATVTQRAADMEVALAIALAHRHKNKDRIIFDKLKKWEGYTAINWTGILPSK